MSNKILLKNGTVLQHEKDDKVFAVRHTDIMIEGDKIIHIGHDIAVDDETRVIDCTKKIVSPGFINAHHHLWQTQLKGKLSNATMLDYMIIANLQSINFTPKDIFLGELAGCLESLDAGTTCIVDNAHMTVYPDQANAALSACLASGARVVFCVGVSPLRASEWTDTSFVLDPEPVPEWLFPKLQSMADRLSSAKPSLVDLGFFFDSYFLPDEIIINTITKAKEIGAKVISSHYRHWPISEGQSRIPEKLQACSLLDSSILLAHGNGTTPLQASLLTSSGTYLVSTPDAESSMASGAEPVTFRQDLPLTCLGADCHSVGPAGMLHQMQAALLIDRAAETRKMFNRGKYPKQLRATTEAVFNAATICAARAIRKEDEIGSIEVGKKADLVIFNASSPAMACATDQDPLVAVVRHASVREVDTVLVGGKICKEHGKLSPVRVAMDNESAGFVSADLTRGGELWSWEEVARELTASTKDINDKMEKVNQDLARAKLWTLFSNLDGILE